MRFRNAAVAAPALAVLAACATMPAEPPVITPEVEGRLIEAMHGFVDDGYAPGVITYVVEDNEVKVADGYGVRNVETGAPMTPDTMIRIASLTKLLTSAAMLVLYDEGAWKPDDPITDFIPEFSDLKVLTEDGELVEPEHMPTIAELMTHTGGFVYGLSPDHPADVAYREANVLDASTDLETMIDKLAEIPLKHQPGTVYEYSVSTDILGAVVQRISGQPFDVFMRERIFEPLDMDDTDFYVHPDVVDRMAALHTRTPDGEFEILGSTQFGDVTQDPTEMPGLPSGGGGLWSNVEDYSHFLTMLENDGVYEGERVLSPEAVELMTTNQLPENIESISVAVINADFAFGGAITSEPSVSGQSMPANSLSWPGIYGVYWWLDQDNDLMVFAAMQVIVGPGVISPGEVAGRAIYGPIAEQ